MKTEYERISDLEKLQQGVIRKISPKRKRHLHKKRICQCWYSIELDSYVRPGIVKTAEMRGN